jgi:hypothetical protein
MDKCPKGHLLRFEQVDFNMVIMIGVNCFTKIVMDHLFVAIVTNNLKTMIYYNAL